MNIVYQKASNKPKALQTKNAKIYPQGYFKDKPCKWCQNIFTPYAPSEHYCSDTCKDAGKRNSDLINKYGITLKQYEYLWKAQKGLCAICGKDGNHRTAYNKSVPLVIDHDHSTHTVRGLLCHTCNTAIGQLNDDPVLLQKAIEYILAKPKIITDVSVKHVLTKGRQTTNVAKTQGREVIKLHLQGLNRAQIAKQLNISEGVIKGIITKTTKTGRKLWETYYKNLESSETIPKGSTSQANGDGSGSPLTGNAEGDDIVQSV